MKTSGASIVRIYLQKYISINQIKTLHQDYKDQALARIALAVAYDIVHEMDSLILSNNANDFNAIERFLRERINVVRLVVKKKQGVFDTVFKEARLPLDFSCCVKGAWTELQNFERLNPSSAPNHTSNFTPVSR